MLELTIVGLIILLGVLLIGRLGQKAWRWIACRGLYRAVYSTRAEARESTCPACKKINIHWRSGKRHVSVFGKNPNQMIGIVDGYCSCIHCGTPYKIW